MIHKNISTCVHVILYKYIYICMYLRIYTDIYECMYKWFNLIIEMYTSCTFFERRHWRHYSCAVRSVLGRSGAPRARGSEKRRERWREGGECAHETGSTCDEERAREREICTHMDRHASNPTLTPCCCNITGHQFHCMQVTHAAFTPSTHALCASTTKPKMKFAGQSYHYVNNMHILYYEWSIVRNTCGFEAAKLTAACLPWRRAYVQDATPPPRIAVGVMRHEWAHMLAQYVCTHADIQAHWRVHRLHPCTDACTCTETDARTCTEALAEYRQVQEERYRLSDEHAVTKVTRNVALRPRQRHRVHPRIQILNLILRKFPRHMAYSSYVVAHALLAFSL